MGVLTVVGGYTEALYWRANRLVPVPLTVDPVQAMPLILNYIVAYQAMCRVAQVKAEEKALIIGASGGIGTVLLELGWLADLQMYGVASQSKHHIVTEMGVIPVDYRTQDFTEVIRIVVQVWSLGPPLHWLQVLYFVLGGVELGLGWMLDPGAIRRLVRSG